MRQLPSRFIPVIAAIVVAATASLAVATVVEAQTTTPQQRPMPGGPMMHGGPGEEHGGPAMHMMREVERLRTSLQLNAGQAALWDKAAAQMKPPANMREEMKARHDRMTAALDDPNFDPRKLSAEMERSETERRARMASIRESWFAVYDSLNPVQRGQVREFLRERMSHRHGMGHGEWMHHREGEPGRTMPGKPPMDGAPTR